jgi:hypothetical protein
VSCEYRLFYAFGKIHPETEDEHGDSRQAEKYPCGVHSFTSSAGVAVPSVIFFFVHQIKAIQADRETYDAVHNPCVAHGLASFLSRIVHAAKAKFKRDNAPDSIATSRQLAAIIYRRVRTCTVYGTARSGS